MRRTMIACLVLVWIAPAQTGEFLRKSTFEERPAVVLFNDKLELTILTTGGSLANLVLKDDPEKMSPFWNPVRMARESGESQRTGPAMGHFVCVDGFGPVSAEERAAGLPGHGEAHTVPWEVTFSGRLGSIATLAFAAELPIVQEKFTRTFRMVDGENIIHVQSELENHLGFDRPVNWAEHATIGSPFLEPQNTLLDLSGKHGKTLKHPARQTLPMRLASFQDFEWPNAPDAGRQDGGSARGPPEPELARSYDYPDGPITAAGLGDGDQYGQAADSRLRVQARGVSVDAGLGGLSCESENGARNGVFDATLRRPAAGGDPDRKDVRYANLPLAAGQVENRTRFLFFYARTPEGFRKVDDVSMQGGKLVVEDRQDGLRIALEASLPL